MEEINVTTEILDLEEARSRLEEIKPEIDTLMKLSRDIRAMHGRMSDLDEDSAAASQLRARLDRLQDTWRDSLKRINEKGATVKDPSAGLIDFYCWHAGELVFLCWRHGEETINAWHGLHEGYAGRKPVSALTED